MFLVQLAGRAETSATWTQDQINSAVASGKEPILWAESNIYGGLDGNNAPTKPVNWDKLCIYASLPVQAIIGLNAKVSTQTQILQLHRPEAISERFQYSYDAELTNVIYVENHDKKWANRFFDLHFLEEVFIPQSDPRITFRNNRVINDNLFMWSRPAGYVDGISRDELLFYIVQSASIYFECAGRVWVEGNQMFWEAIIVNHSQFNWADPEIFVPGALMCFRTRNSLDFDDKLGNRVFYHYTDGRMAKSVFDTDGYIGIYYYQWTCLPSPKFSTRLTKFNQNGSLLVDVESSPGRSVGGNRDSSISCIHANVSWSIPKNSWQKINWVATFHENSRADAWLDYK